MAYVLFAAQFLKHLKNDFVFIKFKQYNYVMNSCVKFYKIGHLSIMIK